jgi:hypothetical protein
MLPDFMSIIDITRACSNVMVAICERWNSTRRSCELFNKLSNALIQDVLNNATNKDAPASSSRQRTTTSTGTGTAMGRDYGAQSSHISQHPQRHSHHQNNSVDELHQTHSGMNSTMNNPADQMPHFNDFTVMDEFIQFSASFGSANLGLESNMLPSEVASGFAQLWPWDDPNEAAADSSMGTLF